MMIRSAAGRRSGVAQRDRNGQSGFSEYPDTHINNATSRLPMTNNGRGSWSLLQCSGSWVAHSSTISRMRILLVEDEHDAAAMLAKGLREQSHAVDVSHDGHDALTRFATNDYDLLVLDVMLPGRSGIDVCRHVRATGSSLPILMLTARDAVDARVEGLDAGADDYLTKPFAFDELLARVRALARRQPVVRPALISVSDLEIDTLSKTVTRGGRTIDLTAKEYALLEFLAQNAETVVGRAEIAEHVWDETFDPFSNLIEVYVQRLRRKIAIAGESKLIATRRGQGYVLSAGADDADV